MKRVITLISAMLLVAVVASAQNPLPKGSKQVNLGAGLSEHTTPVYGGMDFGLGKDLSAGFEVSYRDRKDYWNVWGFSGNVNYHFNRVLNIPKSWDFYAGANVGFFKYSYDAAYKDSHNSSLGLGLQVGGRYYFTDTFGLNFEVGGGNAFAGGKIGVSFRF